MSYETVKEFEYRGFKCSIDQVFPDDGEQPFYDYCIASFVKPTTLDKLLFHAIGEGVRSDAVAAIIDLLGLTAFYIGDFNKDIENIMKIGLIRHDGHIGCYTTGVLDDDGEIADHWKYMTPSEMEDMLKMQIDIYHDARKRMIDSMKMYRNLAQRMQEVMNQIQTGQIEMPKA